MISLLEIAQNIYEADDDRYVHIGYGKFKEKGKEDDEDADVYTKTDSGKYVKSSDQKGDDKGGEEPSKEPEGGEEPSKEPEGGEEKPKPSGKALGKGDFERDFDDTAGDPDDSWDDEEGRAKPTGKTDADTDDDEPKDESEVDGPSPEDDWDTGQVMTAKLDGEEVGDIIGDEGHPKYKEALKYIMSFDPDDERLYTGSGEKEESITINGQKYKPIKESKKHPLKEIYDRTFRSLK